MLSTEEELNAVIRPVADFTESQKTNQCDLDTKLKKLEKDVAMVQ